MFQNKCINNKTKKTSSQKNYNISVKNNNESFLSEIFNDYLTNSTIHGLRYLTKDRCLLEKIWWMLCLVLIITAGLFAIHKLWTRRDDNPVILTFAQQYTYITEIPFPAVTVCPVHKILKSKFNYSDYLRDILVDEVEFGKDEMKMFKDLGFICDKNDEETNTVEFEITDEDIINTIKQVSPNLLDTIEEVYWKKQRFWEYSEIESMFVNRITQQGLCYTFNSFGQEDMYTERIKSKLIFIEHNKIMKDWSVEGGYLANASKLTYPRRLEIHGFDFGLQIMLDSKKYETDSDCEDGTVAFVIALHNPFEEPKYFDTYFFAPTNQKLFVSVTPNIIKTSEILKRVNYHIRKCYFVGERTLRFYKVYTEYNCKMECLVNLTESFCGCTPFFLPRDNNAKICGYSKKNCISESYELLFTLDGMDENYKSIEKKYKKVFEEVFLKCQCYQSCDYIDYEVKISQSHYEFSEINNMDWDRTLLNIYYAGKRFLAVERKELYDDMDFISNIGGLLGLCMGFSILSVLEIIYYLTVRVICTTYNRKKMAHVNPTPKTTLVFVH